MKSLFIIIPVILVIFSIPLNSNNSHADKIILYETLQRSGSDEVSTDNPYKERCWVNVQITIKSARYGIIIEIITPKRLDFKIIESSNNKITLGQTAYFSSKLLTRMTWKTKITACKPYTYVDEMSNTIFKRWKHTHVFHKINENQTKVTDEIEFELQYGFLGKMFEWYALDKLKKIFTHRQQATIEYLSNF